MPYVYIYGGTTFNSIPDPLEGVTPVTKDTFIAMGGTVQCVDSDIETIGVDELGLNYEVLE